MRDFDKPIGRVWRRLRIQRFLTAVVWCWGATLAVAAIVVGVEKLGYKVPGEAWLPFAIAGGVGAGVALLIAAFTGPSRVDAAIAIDRAFGLHERLATALTLPADLSETPAGQALLADARRHVNDLDIGSKFGIKAPRRAWLPLIPGLIAAGLLFAPESAQKRAQAVGLDTAEKQVLVEKTKALGKAMAERRKDPDAKLTAETEKLLAQIEKAADELSKTPPDSKDKAMVKLNKLTDAVQERKKQLADADAVNRQIQQMKQMSTDGPAEELAKSLAKGDFDKAAKELQQLKDKLTSGKLSDSDKKKLQEQVSEMKKQLEKLANLDERKKQLDEAKKNGALSAKQYEQEMAKLDQQSKNLQQMKNLAKALSQCENGMKQGDLKKAADALGMSQQEMQSLAKQMQELQTLDEAMANLQDAKNGMNGEGENMVGDRLDGTNGLGMGNGRNRGNGNGMGRGRGQGDRPEAAEDTASYNTKVKQQITKGKAIFEGFAPPKGVTKGESLIEVQETMEAANVAAEDAMTNQKIPNSIRKHIKGYFDQIKEGR